MKKVALGTILLAALAVGASSHPALVVVGHLDGMIHPAAAGFVRRAVAEAERKGAALFVLQLSTPGGSMSAMRDITTTLVNSRVPVAVFVAPSGSRAASAGFFILLSGDVAAMAPGTNTGAAHPVGSMGEDIPTTLAKKIVEDARAQLRTLCAARGRNVEAAEKAVTESISYTETEAKQKSLIDFVARDLDALVADLDGFRVRRTSGAVVTLSLAHPRFERLEQSAVEKTLGIVSDPQIASILFLIGLVGLYFEFSHPGAILPGVAGAIAMLLALYALSLLPVNFAALALIVLGVFFFIAEVKVSGHGMLALSGLLAFVGGFALLFAGNRFGYAVDLRIILPAAVVCAGTLAALSLRAAALRRRPASTGAEGLIGETGRALSDLAPGGKVMAHGEYWDAIAKAPVPAGSTVRIVGKEGFRLLVEKAEEGKGGL